MRIIKYFTTIALVLFSAVVFGGELSRSAVKEQNPDCVTHTVVNESTNVSSTITRCSGELTSQLPNKQPRPTNLDQNTKENPNPHWDLLNNFDDLAAQSSMASSTFWIVWLTLGTLLVSGVSIYFLRQTINQNRKTFDHIKGASNDELKPYFELKYVEKLIDPTTHNGDEYRNMTARIKVTNKGKTPIKSVSKVEISSVRYVERTKGDVATEHEWSLFEGVKYETVSKFNYLAPNASESVTFSGLLKFKRYFSDERALVIHGMLCFDGVAGVHDVSTNGDQVRNISFRGVSRGWPVDFLRPKIMSVTLGGAFKQMHPLKKAPDLKGTPHIDVSVTGDEVV